MAPTPAFCNSGLKRMMLWVNDPAASQNKGTVCARYFKCCHLSTKFDKKYVTNKNPRGVNYSDSFPFHIFYKKQVNVFSGSCPRGSDLSSRANASERAENCKVSLW